VYSLIAAIGVLCGYSEQTVCVLGGTGTDQQLWLEVKPGQVEHAIKEVVFEGMNDDNKRN
jgi:hypothetical protein